MIEAKPWGIPESIASGSSYPGAMISGLCAHCKARTDIWLTYRERSSKADCNELQHFEVGFGS
jgi:hypothetical protein